MIPCHPIMLKIDDIKQPVQKDFDAMNALISAHLSQEIPLIDHLCHHLMNSGGKRLRPLMALLSAKACCYTGEHHIPLAAALEYFHTATLLHDDVVDGSTLRRGSETANEIWGSKASILVGDYLFTHSVQWFVDARNWAILELFSTISHQISRGEIKQLNFRHNVDVSLADYFDIIRSKTALLFSAAAELGAHLAECSPDVCKALGNYGLHVGNAFQMIDDALDYRSSSEVMGKNVGDDLADGKMTLPLFAALHKATPEQAIIIKESIRLGTLDHLSDILAIIEVTQAMDYTYQLAREEVHHAIVALDILEESPYKQGLLDLAQFSLCRVN